ncbi:uncharacterized protein LOC121376782 [Gigantopelta aegis]|uniref:uncharacterized protein LOC121376782 n=1 Tax=Gigantopelta aegis TaxID=1735272 RepID=UPI001B88C462|nr:uncharacterized protein LOC121376782 [Gigantopelta aegis]
MLRRTCVPDDKCLSSSNNSMFLFFRSDSIHQGSGFKIKYRSTSIGSSCEEVNLYWIGIIVAIFILVVIIFLCYRKQIPECRRRCSQRLSMMYSSARCTSFSKTCPFIHEKVRRICLCCLGSTKESIGTSLPVQSARAENVTDGGRQSTAENGAVGDTGGLSSNSGSEAILIEPPGDDVQMRVTPIGYIRAEAPDLSSVMGNGTDNPSPNAVESSLKSEASSRNVASETLPSYSTCGHQSIPHRRQPEAPPSYCSSGSQVIYVIPPPSYEQVMSNPNEYNSDQLQ